MAKRRPNIVVVGAGFAGVKVCQGLEGVPANVVLIDRHNYHLFQPLLYQVATAALSPADIAFPIRRIFRGSENVECLLAEVSKIDLKRKCIAADGQEVDYDYLVICAGATHSYFGQDKWMKMAPGLKTIGDALEIRKRILLAYEEAENELDDAQRRAKLTFIVVGGGPTGVELAGALREIAAKEIQKDYRNIDTTNARVILIDANERVLKTFHPKLSERAKRDLEKLGVEVRLKSRVTEVDDNGVKIGEERVDANNVFWAAGVLASPLARTIEGVELDRVGCIKVNPDLSVPGYPEVFVAGDLASIFNPETGQPVPGVAPAAMQMGKHVAKVIRQELVSGVKVPDRQVFSYFDKGTMATIGKARAIADIHGWKFSGFFAWLLWSVIHLMFLVSFRSKLLVMINWIATYLFHSNGARLITGDFKPRIHKYRDVTPSEQVEAVEVTR
jgi:NADH dehydrogenase